VASGKERATSLQSLVTLSIPNREVRAALVGLMRPSGPPGQGCETNCPSASRGSGSGVFPAPSVAFDRHRPGLRGLPGTRAASPTEADVAEALVNFTSPTERSKTAGIGSRQPLLSWDSSNVCPLADKPSARPLPGAEAPFGPTGSTHRVKFRPRGSSPPRRFPPRRGRGFVAPRSRTRVRLVSRYTGARRTRAVRRRSPARDAHSGAPRDAVHTLRSLPFADSRTASLRPLPPCRYRPAEAGRRFDSMMLRSAEADPHVTEREVPSRRRSDAGQPRRTSAVGAAPKCSVDEEIGSTPGWVSPSAPSRSTVGRPKTPPGCTATGAAELSRGCIASTEVGGMRIRRTIAERLASRPCSVDEVRCRLATVAGDRRSFLPWASFPFEVFVHPLLKRHRDWAGPRSSGSWPATPPRHEASKGGPAASDHPRAPSLAGRHTSVPEGGGSPGSLTGFTRTAGRSPSPRRHRGAEARPRTGAFSARRSRPLCRDPADPAGRSRWVPAKPVPGRVCPEHES
jgi:hypothetical protein